MDSTLPGLMIWNETACHEVREQLATFIATMELPVNYSHAKRTRNALDTYCCSKVGMKISRCMVYHTHTFKLLQRRLNKRFCFHFSMHNGCVPATQLNRKIFKHTHIRVHCHSVMIEAKECIVSTLFQQSTIKDSQTFSIVYVLLPSKQATHIDSNLGFRLDFVS